MVGTAELQRQSTAEVTGSFQPEFVEFLKNPSNSDYESELRAPTSLSDYEHALSHAASTMQSGAARSLQIDHFRSLEYGYTDVLEEDCINSIAETIEEGGTEHDVKLVVLDRLVGSVHRTLHSAQEQLLENSRIERWLHRAELTRGGRIAAYIGVVALTSAAVEAVIKTMDLVSESGYASFLSAGASVGAVRLVSRYISPSQAKDAVLGSQKDKTNDRLKGLINRRPISSIKGARQTADEHIRDNYTRENLQRQQHKNLRRTLMLRSLTEEEVVVQMNGDISEDILKANFSGFFLSSDTNNHGDSAKSELRTVVEEAVKWLYADKGIELDKHAVEIPSLREKIWLKIRKTDV